MPAFIELPQLFAIWGVIVAAAILRAFTGFGFALASIPAFSMFLTPAESVVLSVGLTLVLSVQIWPQYYARVRLAPMLPLFVLATLGTVLGALLLVRFSTSLFQVAIGLVTILSCLILSFYSPRPRPVPPIFTWGTGLVSGLLNGVFAIPGPPIVIYAMATEPDPEKNRAFLLTFFAFSSALAMGSYAVVGLVNWRSIYLLLVAYPAMYIGDRLGYGLFLRYGHAMYRRVALVTLFALGVVVIVKAIVQPDSKLTQGGKHAHLTSEDPRQLSCPIPNRARKGQLLRGAHPHLSAP